MAIAKMTGDISTARCMRDVLCVENTEAWGDIGGGTQERVAVGSLRHRVLSSKCLMTKISSSDMRRAAELVAVNVIEWDGLGVLVSRSVTASTSPFCQTDTK